MLDGFANEILWKTRESKRNKEVTEIWTKLDSERERIIKKRKFAEELKKKEVREMEIRNKRKNG